MNQFRRLVQFLDDLDSSHTHYTLSSVRTNIIMVSVSVPGERWEIEFEDTGEVYVEKFLSTGRVGRAEALTEFCERHVWPEMKNSGD